MKKIIFLLPLLFCLLSFGQTTRDSLVYTKVKVLVTHDTTYVATSLTTHDSTYTRVDTIKIPISPPDTLIRIMYVNSTNTIAGDQTKVNALITDLNFLKITHTSHYSISATSNQTAMAYLFTRIKNETKVKSISPAISSMTEVNKWVTWNGSHSDLTDVEGIVIEYEPYNQTDFKAAWKYDCNLFQNLYNLCGSGIFDFFMDYKGWWTSTTKDLTPMPTETPDTLVKYFSKKPNLLKLHDYRVKPEFPYMEKRFNDLEASGKESGKVISTVVLFSAEPDFLGPWLAQGHTLDEAFWIIHAALKAKNYKYVKLVGWACFHLDFWRAHKPSQALMVGRSMKATKPIFSKKNFRNKTTKKSKRLVEFTDN